MTSDLTSRAAYSVAKARHRWRKRRSSQAPIVVFSMAKTGSSAVVAALRAGGHDNVHHVHDLDPDFLAAEEAEYRWAGRPWRIWDAQELGRHLPTTSARWRVVSIARDPIAQSVSAFFQPGARRGYLHEGATVESLREQFADRLDRLPLRWFESHVHPAFGIDVYETGFDPTQGHQIIATPTVDLLLLRREDLASVAPAALARLVGDPGPIEVPQVNVAAGKDHAVLYASFLEALDPSEASLDVAYSSRYVQHFYSADEIAQFRQRWSAGTSGRPRL